MLSRFLSALKSLAKANAPSDRFMIAERPTTIDRLGFERLVTAVTDRIATANKSETPFTIGIYGKWGAGKTSFMMMVDKQLRMRKIYPIWFNAWKYQQEDNLWSALIQTILDQAPVNGPIWLRLWRKIRILVGTVAFRKGSTALSISFLVLLLRASLVLAGISLVLGWPLADLKKSILSFDLIKHFSESALVSNLHLVTAAGVVIAAVAAKPTSLFGLFRLKLGLDFSQFQKHVSYKEHISFLDNFNQFFESLVARISGKRHLVIFIDDLDRCTPEKAVPVLEAIKLFLDVKNCIFLMAMDRDLIEKVVALKYKDLAPGSLRPSFGYGEEYFEKIIQIPLALPPVSDLQFKSFLDSVCVHKDAKLCIDIFLAGLPTNPRKAKRLLQTFMLVRDLASTEIESGRLKVRLIAKIVVLQEGFRRLYNEILMRPILLSELERHFNQPNGSDKSQIPDLALAERVSALAAENDGFKAVLSCHVDGEEDSFLGANVSDYLYSVTAIAQFKVDPFSTKNTEGMLQAYLRLVINTTRSLAGIGEWVTDLNKVYLPLHLSRLGRKGSGQRNIPAEKVGDHSIRSIIFGGPGTGKSTLLRHIANDMAKQLLDSEAKSHQVGEDQLLPVLIPLRDVHNPDLLQANSFAHFLVDYFGVRGVTLTPDFFGARFHAGSANVLLDGLDEIADATGRARFLNSIRETARSYPGLRITITSRTSAQELTSLASDFTPYEITRFSDSELHDYVVRRAEQTGISIEDNAELIGLLQHPRIRPIVGNPLILDMLLSLYQSTKVIPTTRVNILSAVIDLFLARWDQSKGLDRKTQLPPLVMKSLIASLALRLYSEGAAETVFSESLAVRVFEEALSESGFTQDNASLEAIQLLDYFGNRAGLIVEVSLGQYSFSSRPLQEYLAGVALARNVSLLADSLARYSETGFHDVLLFAVASLAEQSKSEFAHLMEVWNTKKGPTEQTIFLGECLIEARTDVSNRERGIVITKLRQIWQHSKEPAQVLSRVEEVLEQLTNQRADEASG